MSKSRTVLFGCGVIGSSKTIGLNRVRECFRTFQIAHRYHNHRSLQSSCLAAIAKQCLVLSFVVVLLLLVLLLISVARKWNLASFPSPNFVRPFIVLLVFFLECFSVVSVISKVQFSVEPFCLNSHHCQTSKYLQKFDIPFISATADL